MSADAPQRYPLAWPAHRPRTPGHRRTPGQYKSAGRPINALDAMYRLEAEVERMGGQYPILSSNVELRMDGRPRSDRSAPTDPGVCLYFTLKGEPMAMACDCFSSVPQNIAALAAHIEAVRKIERLGVATAAETLRAFLALPAPEAGPVVRPWHVVLDISREAILGLGRDIAGAAIDAAYRAKAAGAHPDRGGSAEAMAEITRARDEAKKAVGL